METSTWNKQHTVSDTFSTYHPVIGFLWFGLVFVFSIFLMNPLYLMISSLCALIYSFLLNGKQKTGKLLLLTVPLLLITGVSNPAFNHEGATVLFYLSTGNPVTREAVCYGFTAGLLIAAVILWFFCYSAVMTSDKFVYLFGRVIPALSLVLSMSLRFVPKFRAKFSETIEARSCLGKRTDRGKLLTRVANAAGAVSIMITWSLENAIETADSMKSRGYGLPGRTAFSIYRWEKKDLRMGLWILACFLFLLLGYRSGALYFRFYPTIKSAPVNLLSVSSSLIFTALCLTPSAVDLSTSLVWKRLEKA